MLVCHCKGLTDRAVRKAVKSGASSVGEVARACGAGGDCGSCRPVIQEIVDEATRPSVAFFELELEGTPAR